MAQSPVHYNFAASSKQFQKVVIMLFASGPISRFIQQHPSFKILALCFLMMIGVSLLAEGLHFEIPKGYIYFSMAFAFLVDVIQMKTVKKVA